MPAPSRQPISDAAHVAAVADAIRTLTVAVDGLEEVLHTGEPGGPLTLPDLRHERTRLDKLIRRLTSA